MAQSGFLWFQRARAFLGRVAEVRFEALRHNAQQVYYLSPIAILGSIAHILIFAFGVSVETETEAQWRSGIIDSHILLTSSMLVLFLVNLYATRPHSHPAWLHVVQYLGIVIVLLAGVGITVIDQLVRSQIIPYLTASVAVALLFRMEPFVAIVAYTASYLLFAKVIHVTQADPILLSSNLVNGITVVGVGLSLSLVLWRNFVRNQHQEARIKWQQQEIYEKNRELERLASIDPLTELLNRRSFEERFAAEIARIATDGGTACLALMDVDDFKQVNDEFGHPIGDALLKRIAQVLTQNQRPGDLISRLGGEEFLVFFPGTTAKQGAAIAETLRSEIESRSFDIEGHAIHVTVSFGVTYVDTLAAKPFIESYRRADRALYLAKEAGKNRVNPCSQGR